MAGEFREIDWPYESVAPTKCPGCGHVAKADATTRCYWMDNLLELRCRKCSHQWTLATTNWSLAGKVFVDGERVDGREA